MNFNRTTQKRRKLDIISDFNELYTLLRKLGVPVPGPGVGIMMAKFEDAIIRWRDDGGR
jgi:hypothetical protein